MESTEPAEFPPFADAVQQAIDIMCRADGRLRQWRSEERRPEVEHRLLHLISMTALADQRGRHLVTVTTTPDATANDDDLPTALKHAYDALVTHLPSETDFVAAQFVLEVGAVYRGVVHHVERA